MKMKWSFWKEVGMMFKIIGLRVVVALLAPIGYLAWRAGQPMRMPEYDGRTYYELVEERQQAYDELSRTYQASHPNVDVKFGMCYRSELLVIAYNMPWAGFCTLAGVVPGLNSRIGPNASRLGCGQNIGSWLKFMGDWWDMYEHLTYNLLSHAEAGPVPYCRIPAP
jgi:hypothetical protein